ncbi:PREDICTED: uncharacterized protein LOC109474297 [Branchiostoma belcheri]|uniref:Uncharacterized protein LOC109474297 n=1 Tax=Branchiostoma belcheri TaxID=7741 RepID=A0A6P4Z0U2_BRABE|nr:PREDICTED: uncharacterized protein LOC109474297 [Branchiostoma belcheri]
MAERGRILTYGSCWRYLIIIITLLVASRRCDVTADSQILQKCHMKPFGCHKPPSGTVKVIDSVPDPETFYREYVRKSTPVLMKGGAAHWPAVQKWPGNEEYLTEAFGDEVFKVDFRKVWKSDFAIKKKMKIRDYLKMYRDEPVYLDSSVSITSQMYKDMELPACLACPEQTAKLTSVNLLYSSGNTSYVIHHDGVDNILTVVSGRKTVLVSHPKYSHQLYMNDFTVLPGLAPLDPEEIDLVRYPGVAEVDYTIAELEAGDMLFVPQYWYHQVRSEGDPNIAFSIWFEQFTECNERVEDEVDPDLMVVESTEVFLRCLEEQPQEISCKQGTQNLSQIIASLPEETKENWVVGYKSGDIKEAEPVPDKKMASGYSIPVLGLGTARMYQKTYDAVLFALKSGYRMIDTAQAYMYSEESIGRAIKDSGVPRKDIFIITKLAPKFFGFGPTKKSVDVSLEKLGTDYIDLFLIHSPDCEEEGGEHDGDDSFKCPLGNPKASWEESWKAMEELHREGKIRSLGVSNFYPKHLSKLVGMAEVPVSLVQNWFDPFYQDQATREFCRQHGIVYQGYSTLGTQWPEMIDPSMANPILTHPEFHRISSAIDRSIPSTVLRWAIQKDVVVIPKAVTEKYILNNLNVLEMDLSDTAMEAIDESIIPVEIDEDGEPILDDATLNRIMGNVEETPEVHIPDFRMPSGHTIPVFGIGVAGMIEKTYDLVLFALKSGYRMIDTAQSYYLYHSEEEVGRAIKDSGIPREEIFLITKLAPRFFGHDLTLDSVQESLEKLGMDYIDLLLIHDQDCSDPHFQCAPGEPKGSWEESWKAMEELHNKGKVRSLGVSNFYPKQLEKLLAMAEVPVSVVQNWFDPFYRDEATRDFCEQHGIVYQGYSTLGGMWTDWIFRRKAVERTKNPVLTSSILAKLSKTLDIPVANIVLRWALQKGVVIIPKSVKKEHILNNLQVLNMELNELSVRIIDEKITPVKIDEDGVPSVYTDDKEWGRIVGSPEDSKQQDIKVQKNSKDQKRTKLLEAVNLEDETIFVGSDDGKMYALDGETGKVKWTFTTEKDLGSSPAFSPDQSVVYFGTEDGHVNALHAKDGQVVWRYKTGASVTCSPSVGADGTVYIGTLDNQMYAFTPDGSVKWSRDLGGEIWTHPAIGHDGRLVYVGTMSATNFNAFALDSQTGIPAWSFKAAGPIWAAPTLSPDGRYVYYSSQDSHIYTLRADSGSLVRKFDLGEDHDGMDSTPVISRDGTLFVGTIAGSVMAVDIRRGKLKWEKVFGGEIMSSPVLDNEGYLYIGSGEGQLALLKLKQKDGSVVWKFPAGEEIWSSPRLDKHGRVYIGSNSGPVFCVDRETGRMVWSYETEGPVVATLLITAEHQYVYEYGQGTENKDEL